MRPLKYEYGLELTWDTDARPRAYSEAWFEHEKKRDTIPLQQMIDLQDKVLDRLGYGLQPEARTPAPSTIVQVNVPQTMVTVPVSPHDLEAARQALRRSESMKLSEPRPLRLETLDDLHGGSIVEAEAALVDSQVNPLDEGEGRDEPLP